MPKSFVTITTPDGACEAYLSAPDGAGTFSPVLFYMDGVGYRPAVHAMADRIAAGGATSGCCPICSTAMDRKAPSMSPSV